MINMDAIPEDFDSDADMNLAVCLAKLEDGMPPEVKWIWDNMPPVEKDVVKVMLIGAMSYGISLVTTKLGQVIEDDKKGG